MARPANIPRSEEGRACRVCGVAIKLGDPLGVEPDRPPRVGMAEPGLGGLDVDSASYECGGIGPAQIMKPGTLATDGQRCWLPHAASLVGVAQPASVRGFKEVALRVGACDPSRRHVLCHDLSELARDGERSFTGI